MSWIENVAERLDLPGREKEHVLEELADHYEQQRKRLLADGMNAEEAEAEAARILGDPREVAATLQSVHSRASWKSALLAAAPFLLFALLPVLNVFSRIHPVWGLRVVTLGNQAPYYVMGSGATAVVTSTAAVMVIAGVAMLCVALREIRHGRCHLWAATWLAVGVTLPVWALSATDGGALFRGLHAPEPAVYLWCNRVSSLAGYYTPASLAAAVICAAGMRSRIGVVAASTALVVAASATLGWEALLLPGVGCLIALISIAGARVFAYPTYGNAANWSLFGFSIFVSICSWYIASEARSTNSLPFLGLCILIACVSCVAFARCSDWTLKKLWLVPGIVAVPLLTAFGTSAHMDLWTGANVAEQWALGAAAVVFGIPAAYGLIMSRRQPSMADRPLYVK